jgi:hypothetical protein
MAIKNMAIKPCFLVFVLERVLPVLRISGLWVCIEKNGYLSFKTYIQVKYQNRYF